MSSARVDVVGMDDDMYVVVAVIVLGFLISIDCPLEVL